MGNSSHFIAEAFCGVHLLALNAFFRFLLLNAGLGIASGTNSIGAGVGGTKSSAGEYAMKFCRERASDCSIVHEVCND